MTIMSRYSDAQIRSTSPAAVDVGQDDITRVIAAPQAMKMPGFESFTRLVSAEVVFQEPVYALAVGPKSSFSEMFLADKGVEVGSIARQYGPPIETRAVAHWSARRPWIGYIRPGAYRVFMKRTMPGQLDIDWYAPLQFTDKWLATGDGVLTDMVWTGNNGSLLGGSVGRFDVLAYHRQVALESLPRKRDPYIAQWRYRVDLAGHFANTGMAAALPVGSGQNLHFHTEDRRRIDFHIVEENIVDSTANWAYNVYGVSFGDCGPAASASNGEVSELRTTALFSGVAALRPNVFSLSLDNAFPGWIISVNKSVGDVSDFHVIFKAYDD